MTSQTLTYRSLLREIRRLLSAGLQPDPQAVADLRSLLQQFRLDFLNALDFPPKNPEARRHLSDKEIFTSQGKTELSQADVQKAIALSDQLDLNEIYCVELLQTSYLETGRVSIEAATGIYLEERLSLVEALFKLFEFQILHAKDASQVLAGSEMLKYVSSFNLGVLSEVSQDSKSMLLQRILSLMKSDVPIEGAQSQEFVSYQYGSIIGSKVHLLQQEQVWLSRCFFYGTCIMNTSFKVEKAALFCDNIHSAVTLLINKIKSHAQALESKALATQAILQQLYYICFGVLASLTPSENVHLQSNLRYEAGKDQVLQTLMDSLLENAQNGLLGLILLAWGILQVELHCAPGGQFTQNPKWPTYLRAALKCKVPVQDKSVDIFYYAAENVFNSVTFNDEAPDMKDACADVVHNTVVYFLQFVEKDAQSGSMLLGTGTYFPDDQIQGGQILGSVLTLLAALYRVDLDLHVKCNALNPLMHHGAERQPESSTFVPLLDLYTSLATGTRGATYIFNKLLTPSPSVMGGSPPSWSGLYAALWEYCSLFKQEEIPAMKEDEATTLAAYLELLAHVLENGAPNDIPQWLSQLQSLDLQILAPHHRDFAHDNGYKPLFPLFFLQQQAIPAKLKGALLIAARSFAPISNASLAEQVWRFLESSKLLADIPKDGSTSMPIDIRYQLAEVETRAEEYSSTLAFLKLLNRLLMSSQSFHTMLHSYVRFVREGVLAPLMSRGYKDKEQKWDLARECLTFLELTLQGFNIDEVNLEDGKVVLDKVAPLQTLQDFLSKGPGCRAIISIIQIGVNQLIEEKHTGVSGYKAELAIETALNLLMSVFQMDRTAANKFNQVGPTYARSYKSIENHMQNKDIWTILGYVRYHFSPSIQVLALQIAQILEERIPELVSILLSPQVPGNTASKTTQQLVYAFAECLQDSLFKPVTTTGQKDSGIVEKDDRASLILNLLLRPLAAKRPGPNLTHLLLGFNLEAGISNTHIDVMSFSPLQVMTEALYQYKCHSTWPQEVEQMLQLLSHLLSDAATSSATLELLRSLENNYFMDVLHVALISPIPHDSPDRIYYIWQIKWILQIHATALHKSLLEVQQDKEDCKKLLQGLIGDAVKSDATSLPYCAILMTLQFCKNALQFEKPALKQDARLIHLQRQMQVNLLLSAPELVSEGGVRAVTERGVIVYHIPSLGTIMARLFKDLEVNCGWSIESEERMRANEVLEETLRFAQSYNVYSQIAHAVQELLSSWEQLVSVTFSRHDTLAMDLRLAPTGSTGFQTLLAFATASLEGLDLVSSTSHAHMSQPMARVCNILMASALKHTKSAMASSLLFQGLSTDTLDVGSCHKFFTVLVNCLSKPGDKIVRQYLYGALIFYLLHTKLTKTPELPSMILEKYQDLDERFHFSSLQHLDGVHEILDQGNMSIMQQQASRLVQAFGHDIVDGAYFTKALALHALSMLMAADPLGTILQEVLSSGMVVTLVRDLEAFSPGSAAPGGVRGGPGVAARDLYIFKAILTLFLEVACTKEGCLALASSGLTRSLASNKIVESALDTATGLGGPGSGLAHLGEISALALQIVLAVSVGLPDSRDVSAHAREFLERHSKVLFSCLSKRTLPIAGLVMSMLSNLFRGRDALDPFFVAQCRGHIIALAWDLLPLTALLDAVRRARESAGSVVLASGAGSGAEGREREEQGKLVGAEAKAALSVAVSTLECLKTMATMEDSESVFEHRARRDWHRSHGKQVVTIDLLERTLQCAQDLLFDLIELKVQICSYLEENMESSRVLGRRMDQAIEVEDLTSKTVMVLEYVLHVMVKVFGKHGGGGGGGGEVSRVLPVLERLLQVASGGQGPGGVTAKVAMEPLHVLVRQFRSSLMM